MSAWNQLEQLLTCAICLDRYRNPKLLPCHHTYCQEPCLEGLVDYARRQIKCPECRAEHRIPYQGVQTFPTNVTLCRFLELHRGITGEEPEPVPSMMERCGVCSEKSSVERCAHCDKKVCPECKEAHLDIIRRELTRINSQVRRALTRLQDSVNLSERNSERLAANQSHIKDEIEETVRRFVKDIKDKEQKILHELEEYATQEIRSLNKLQEDLNIEASTIQSNCELIEKHVLEQQQPWTDTELVEYKDIFLKTLDFLRNFDSDTSDYARRIRFVPNSDLDLLRKSIINFGELKLPVPENKEELSPSRDGSTLSVPQGPGGNNALMRSQSDHRLAAQYAKTERARYLETSGSTKHLAGYSDSESTRDGGRATSPSFGRRGGKDQDRYGTSGTSGRYGREEERSRYGSSRDDPYRNAWPRPDDDTSGGGGGSHFKSRFMRDRNAETEDESDFGSGHRTVRFEDPPPEREVVTKVFDTKDAPRGPLSGVVKLVDTAHMMTRIHQNDIKSRKEKELKDEETRMLAMSTPVTTPAPTSYQTSRPRPPVRQVSEDEIEKQKQANKAAAAATSTTSSVVAAVTTPTSPVATSPSSRTPPEPLSSANKNSVSNTSTDSTASSRFLPRRVSTLREEHPETLSSRRSSDASSQSPHSSRRGSDASSTVDDPDDGDDVSSRLSRRRKSSTITPIDVDARSESSSHSTYSGRSAHAQQSSANHGVSSPTTTSSTNRQVSSEYAASASASCASGNGADFDDSPAPVNHVQSSSSSSSSQDSPVAMATNRSETSAAPGPELEMKKSPPAPVVAAVDSPPPPPATAAAPEEPSSPTTPTRTRDWTSSYVSSRLKPASEATVREITGGHGVGLRRSYTVINAPASLAALREYEASKAEHEASSSSSLASLRNRQSASPARGSLSRQNSYEPKTPTTSSYSSSMRDYSSRLRSKSPSADRSEVTSTASSRATRDHYSPPPRRLTAADLRGQERPNYSRFRDTAASTSTSSSSAYSRPAATGLARSSTVGDMLSRSTSRSYDFSSSPYSYSGSSRPTGSSGSSGSRSTASTSSSASSGATSYRSPYSPSLSDSSSRYTTGSTRLWGSGLTGRSSYR